MFIPGHTWACPGHQWQDTLEVSAWEASILGQNPFFRQSQREVQGQEVSTMVCTAGRLQGEGVPSTQAVWPKAALLCRFSTERVTSRGRVLLEHVGINSPQCSIHWPYTQALPQPTEGSWASPCTSGASISSTKEGYWRNWSKEEKLGNKELSQVYIKLSHKTITVVKVDICNRYTQILHISQTSVQ